MNVLVHVLEILPIVTINRANVLETERRGETDKSLFLKVLTSNLALEPHVRFVAGAARPESKVKRSDWLDQPIGNRLQSVGDPPRLGLWRRDAYHQVPESPDRGAC